MHITETVAPPESIVCDCVHDSDDHAATPRIIARQTQSVTHHSVSAPTIRHRLQQSGMPAGPPLLLLPLIGNHRRLHRQWCDERWAWTLE
ncbi:transposable element Tcb1 transposase [Trichonephila clavipes]|nr:transposable element Tcb1 transposase [Trichonephila clavipes]